MFLEKQLKLEFQKKAEQLQSPKDLDQHVYQLIDNHFADKQSFGSRQSAKKSFFQRVPKVAVFALALLLFTGFAFGATQLFSIQLGNLDVQVGYDKGLTLVNTSPEEIRKQLEQVQAQLEPGESAIAYLPELEQEPHPLINQFPFMKVTKPILYKDIDIWLQYVGSSYEAMKQPAYLPEGFSFEGGVVDLEFWGAIMWEDSLDEIELLRQRASDKLDWVKYDSTKVSPTLIYKNNADEQILISVLEIDSIVKIESTMNDVTEYEQLEIRGNEGFYTNNPDHILYQGNVQGLSWFEKQGQSVFSYQIQTESPHVTKEDLIRIAESMQ